MWGSFRLAPISHLYVPASHVNLQHIICYDHGCHLRKYCRNSAQQSLTTESKRLASIEKVIDKMHMRGHIDTWCKEHCNPSKSSALCKLYKAIIQHANKLLSCSMQACNVSKCCLHCNTRRLILRCVNKPSHGCPRITQKMGQHTFFFYLLYLCEIEKLSLAGFQRLLMQMYIIH